ncbi:MAG: Rpn family recombination-promoting nuclease/putative transposase, partial [Bacteroides sp.]
MGKFINPFTDMGFKRIFGQEFSKPLLLDFLNNLLKGERHIVDLRFLDKEQPAEYVGDRSLIYDIYCETDNGDKIIVEMQNRDQPYFKNRSIYYISEAIARQGERGSVWNYNIKAVYLVAFLNFTQEEIGSKFRTDVVLADRESKETFSEMLRMVYLQLPYFQKEADACENDFERWIYVLKNMETLNRMPWMAKNSLFERLSQIAEVGALSREERMKYDRSLKALRDTYS